jgi:hypothetical protein
MASFNENENKIFVPDAQNALAPEPEKPDCHTANAKKGRKPMRALIVGTALVVAIVAALGLTMAAAPPGGYNWLMKKANPPFADVVKPVGQSAVFQGIKATAVAAANSGDMAILYVTLEDTERLGRVAEDTEIGFDLTQSVQSISADQIYFDADTGIAAYQIRLGSPGTFDGQSLPLQVSGLSYGKVDLGEVRMEIDLAKAAAQGEHIGQPYPSNKQAPGEQLAPGHLADIPGTKSAWVSAIGVNHGYLAVQFAQPAIAGRYMDANSIVPYLLDSNGNTIDRNGPGGIHFKADSQLNPVHSSEQGAYNFMEAYFAVDTEQLDGYALCFKGSVRDVVSGQWNLDISFDGIQLQSREISADIKAGNAQLDDVLLRINPFGMTLTGNGAPSLNYGAPMAAAAVLETTEGNIELQGNNASRANPDGPFELVWYAPASIDLDNVIAVRIGDNTLALK